MAQAPGHRFGQIIGDMLEFAIRRPLMDVAEKRGLYLDWKHARSARNGRKLVKWDDSKGNSHDLDYVLEQGGSEENYGRPKAFIEIAYRRYTKHSRNKAQEIQGAISPLAEKYSDDHPFLGVVLAGVFTEASLTQLRSHHFGVLYFPFEAVVDAFRAVGIDAYFDEETPDTKIIKKIKSYLALSERRRIKIGETLMSSHKDEVAAFIAKLEECLSRAVAQVFILPLHGEPFEIDSLEQAIDFIKGYKQEGEVSSFIRYELNVRYNNGNEIRGSFGGKIEAISFLRKLI